MMDNSENSLSFVLDACYQGSRLDKVLAVLCEDLSREGIKNLILSGNVLLDGSVVKQPSLKVEEGQDVVLSMPEPVPCDPEPENIPFDILYEDGDVIVINKPVGLVVHPGVGNWSGTLVNALLHYCGDTLSGIGGVIRPGIVHRLDKETSGAIIVAKNDMAHRSLSEQLKDRSLTRIYHALVLGVPMPIKGVVDRAIGRHKSHRLKMSVMSPKSREAITRYQVIESFGEFCSLVECQLETGRTHQIRVHMEDLGHPILGDQLYGPQATQLKSKLNKFVYNAEIKELIINLSRQMLHAKRICFIHPRTGDKHQYDCSLAPDFQKVIESLN